MIHKFEINNIKIVLDVNSGSVHIIDDLVWDILECGENASLEEIESKLGHKYQNEALHEAYNEMELLKEQGLLFSKWSVDKPEPVGQPVIKAMCLHAAHDCNLRCSYCFASTGDFKGTRSLLDEKTGRRALEFLVEHSGRRRNLEVDFFGGEPLMNFEVVKKLVAYGRELEKSHHKKFKFTVTTNGLLLNDEIIEYINREFSNVVVSIDGRPEVHDHMRKTVNGLGSHGLILSKAKKLAESRRQRDYFVRGTFTRHNLDFYKDVLYLADQGFQNISIFC